MGLRPEPDPHVRGDGGEPCISHVCTASYVLGSLTKMLYCDESNCVQE